MLEASISSEASWNAPSVRSVFSRTPLTVKSVAFAPCASGPADLSRSSCSAAARSVACLVMSVSSRMLSSCWMSSIDWLMRSVPSVVAATTGRVSSATRRVEMRQLRSATREPVLGEPAGGCTVGVGGRAFADVDAAGRPERSPLSPDGPGPGFWACWGEEPRSVPPCGSGSAEALPSLLKRPCTSVATSGPGAPPLERKDGVGVLKGVLNTPPES
ncbi:hypothetical protein SAURM35S_06318 [Streptomyces aurantiogriseus]